MKESIYFKLILVLALPLLLICQSCIELPNKNYEIKSVKFKLLNADELEKKEDTIARFMLFRADYGVVVPGCDIVDLENKKIIHIDDICGDIDYILDTVSINCFYKDYLDEIIGAYYYGHAYKEKIIEKVDYEYFGFWKKKHIHDISFNFIYVENLHKIDVVRQNDHDQRFRFNIYLAVLWLLFLILIFRIFVLFYKKNEIGWALFFLVVIFVLLSIEHSFWTALLVLCMAGLVFYVKFREQLK